MSKSRWKPLKADKFNYFDAVQKETQLKYGNIEKLEYLPLNLTGEQLNDKIIYFHLKNHLMHHKYTLTEILTSTEQLILDLLKSKFRKEKRYKLPF